MHYSNGQCFTLVSANVSRQLRLCSECLSVHSLSVTESLREREATFTLDSTGRHYKRAASEHRATWASSGRACGQVSTYRRGQQTMHVDFIGYRRAMLGRGGRKAQILRAFWPPRPSIVLR